MTNLKIPLKCQRATTQKKCVNPGIFSLVSEFFSNLFPWIFLKVLQLEGMLRETSLISDLQIPSLRDLTSGIHWVFPNGVTRSGWLELSATRHRRKKNSVHLNNESKIPRPFCRTWSKWIFKRKLGRFVSFSRVQKKDQFFCPRKKWPKDNIPVDHVFFGWDMGHAFP